MKKIGKELFQVINTGISYFLPVIIVSGMLFAIVIATGTVENNQIIPSSQFFKNILVMAQAGFSMMVPVLAAYIAYGIAGKPGLAPGFTLGYVANNPIGVDNISTGFIGAMVVGIFAGYFVNWMKSWKVPMVIKTVMPILIMPLLATLCIGIIYVHILSVPLAAFVVLMTTVLSNLNGVSAAALGLGIGIMAAIDMGGPSSKAATAFTLALMAEGIYAPNGAFRICCAVPPLGLALSTFISGKKYSKEEKQFGISAFFLSMAGITEGAIPFAAKDFKRIMPAIIIGTGISGVLGMLHHVESIVAFGGLVALPAVTSGALWYVVDMFAGAFVIVIYLHIMKKNVEMPILAKEKEISANVQRNVSQG